MAVQVAVRSPERIGSSRTSKVVPPATKDSPALTNSDSAVFIWYVIGFLPVGRRVTRSCLPSERIWKCSRDKYSSQGTLRPGDFSGERPQVMNSLATTHSTNFAG